MLDFLGGILFDAIAGVIGGLLGDRWRARRAKRRQRKRELVCCLRVLHGDRPGLTRHWQHGKARLSPGEIEFRPKAPWAGTSTIVVRSTSRRHQRQPRGWEAWVVVYRQARVVEVSTGDATLEWAVSGEQLHWAIAQVRQATDAAPAALGNERQATS